MSLMPVSWRTPSTRCCAITVFSLALAATLVVTPAARAQDDDAAKILKSMSDYMASQKSFSLSFDTDIEVITSEIQKIQFASSGKLLLSRPDKLRASRTAVMPMSNSSSMARPSQCLARTSMPMRSRMLQARSINWSIS